MNLASLLGFFFALRICTLLLFQSDPQMGVIFSASIGIVFMLSAVLISMGDRATIPASCFRTLPIRWMGVFLLFALLSIQWTVAPVAEALGYWTAWVSDIVTVWFLMHSGDAEGRAVSVLKGYVWGACLVAVIAWSLPTMSDLRLGDESFLHPNELGLVFSIAIMMGMYLAREGKIWRWLTFLLAITLLRTISKTSIIAFCGAMTFYLFREKTLTRTLKIRIGLAATAITISLWNLLERYFDTYNQGASPETLTGRTLIWASALQIAMEKPIFGNGFYSFRFLIPPLGTFEAGHAHNELLQQFFTYGAAGLFLAAGLYYVFFLQIRRAPGSSLRTLASTLLIFALIRGLADTERDDLSLPLWLMTLLSILLAMASNTEPEESGSLLPEDVAQEV